MDDQISLPALIDLSDKRALVTGGGKGIGAAVTRRLREAGAHVVVADLDPGSADVAAEMGAVFVECDITNSTQLAAAIEVCAGDEGMHILVNNAGIYPTTGPIGEKANSGVGT